MAHMLSLSSIYIVPSKAILCRPLVPFSRTSLKFVKNQEIPSGAILSKGRYILLSKIPN